MALDIAERIAPLLPQFEESEHQEGQRFSSAVAADPTADRVKVQLRCPSCGAEADTATTLLRQEPSGHVFSPGDRWPLRMDRINRYWFLDVQAPAADGPLVVLDGGCCQGCGADLWFEMTFEQQHLARTRQVALSRAALDRCHACTAHAALVAAALVGGQAHQLATEDVMAVLRARLARPDQVA
ncbi:MAG TPA: hypothetical protein VND93_12775 [Myxococcales bacterium]|jgi:hypothetical protein|nr:hypothetical protein [Myxococcales bacterium]